jgi:ankyrin repeat protein
MPSNKQMFISIIHVFRDYPNHLALIKKTIRNQIANGFNINTKYLKGKTLGHYVVKYNVSGLFIYLLKCGLNLDICDDNYDTPLHLAVKNNRIILVKELINCKVDINMACEFEATPLHLAVSEGHSDIVKLLLKAGADVSLVDERNQSPLDYALDEKNDHIVNLLKNKK